MLLALGLEAARNARSIARGDDAVGRGRHHARRRGAARVFEVINEEVDRLNHFVENMAELARIEAGAVSLRRRWSSVEEIVALARAG
jgi:K+-sensing histidine kinase KdpD